MAAALSWQSNERWRIRQVCTLFKPNDALRNRAGYSTKEAIYLSDGDVRLSFEFLEYVNVKYFCARIWLYVEEIYELPFCTTSSAMSATVGSVDRTLMCQQTEPTEKIKQSCRKKLSCYPVSLLQVQLYVPEGFFNFVKSHDVFRQNVAMLDEAVLVHGFCLFQLFPCFFGLLLTKSRLDVKKHTPLQAILAWVSFCERTHSGYLLGPW